MNRVLRAKSAPLRAGMPTRIRAAVVVVALVVVALAVAACTGSADAEKADPNRPAVVQVPPPILPSDTAQPDTMPEHLQRMADAKAELSPLYSMMAAMAIMGDRRTLSTDLAPDVVIRLGDSTYTGRVAATNALVAFMRRASISDMGRSSRVLSAVGSVYTDSGEYGMLSRREGGTPVEQRGNYVSVWTRYAMPQRWELQRDELIPFRKASKR